VRLHIRRFMESGRVIALEGGEGAGKTTIWNVLEQLAKGNGSFTFCREPGGTTFGEKVRQVIFAVDEEILPETEMMLFMASRLELFKRVVRPALRLGRHVVTDRLDASTYVYQIYAPRRLWLEPVFRSLQRVYLSPPTSDSDWIRPVYILLDIDPVVGLARAKSRKVGNKFDDRPVAYHQMVREGYNHYIKGEKYHAVIDASLPLDEIVEKVRKVIWEFTGVKL